VGSGEWGGKGKGEREFLDILWFVSAIALALLIDIETMNRNTDCFRPSPLSLLPPLFPPRLCVSVVKNGSAKARFICSELHPKEYLLILAS
jgi:hypothetical protein